MALITDTITKRPALHGLTGIRFFAAFAVLLYHYGAGFADRAGVPKPITTFLHNGYFGVSLFFMLSGFIITYTYDGRLNSRRELRDFAVARFSRLYPVYLLALMLALPFPTFPLTWFDATAVLLMLQCWTMPTSPLGFSWVMQAWTLSVELFFYLCAPLILRSLRTVSSRTLLVVAAICTGIMVAVWVPAMTPTPDRYVGDIARYLPVPLMRTTEFLYGTVLCKLYVRHGDACRRFGAGPLVWINLAAIVALLASSDSGYVVSIAMVLTGPLILQIAAADTPLSRFLSLRPLLLLGGSSYALYLIQSPIRAYVALLPDQRLGSALNPFVVVAASVLIYRLWEEPARRWLRKRLSDRSQPPSPALASEVQPSVS
jgi:peptidoglycan/LPS O-acetylase OafA/YrhL